MKKFNCKAIPKSASEPYESHEEVFELANAAIQEKFNFESVDQAECFHGLLTWIKSDTPYANAWWHWVHKNKIDFLRRDAFILELWRSLNNPKSANYAAKKQVENQITDWSYYENHFFHWFLARYHITNARSIFTDNKIINNFHRWFWLFPLATILNYYLIFYQNKYSFIGSILSLFILSVGSLLAAKYWGNIDVLYFIHSMVPRLGATVAIGYFFLFSVRDFVEIIYDNSLDPLFQIIGSVILILFTFGFIFLNIHKRVKPQLKCSELTIRALDIFTIAATYAMIGLLVFERVFITLNPEISKPCFSQLFFFASISLAIGVIFQLIWEEKPVTEPL